MFSPYEFKRTDAIDFAHFVGIQAKEKGEELQFVHCPFCKGGKSRDKGSFAINLKSGAYHCLRDSCGAKGNMITLARDFDFSLGTEVDEYYRPQKTFKKLETPKTPIVPKKEALSFLEKRGISKNTAEKYEISVVDGKENVISFPFYDEVGILRFLKYRNTTFVKGGSGSKEWCEANCRPILFGMKQCNQELDWLVVTEGQMDSLAVYEAGIENAVSVPTGAKGMTWIPYCWNFVNGFKRVIVFGDYEKGKISLLEDISKRFRGIQILHVRDEDYMDCKDANEILLKHGKNQIRKCIENAIAVPITNTIDISDVRIRDAFKIPKLGTGVSELDNLLYGGLPFGFVTVLGGKRGDGKSTFASQLIKRAVEQGYKSFVYSGEMSNGDVKNALYMQIAGRHIVENTNQFGQNYWFISNQTRESIDNWCRGKIILYDADNIEDETVDLVDTIEKMIVQEGVQVILLDNLMTAIETGNFSKNEFDAQRELCGSIRKLAKKYNVLIILVAHRRKNSTTTDTNDEISGTAYITNIAGVVMSYDRCKEDGFDPLDRKLVVSKNRLFGKLHYDGITLHFNEKCKRIYGDKDLEYKDSEWSYSLNPRNDGFEQINDDLEEIPY